MSGEIILGRLRVGVLEVQGLEGYSAKDGIFASVIFQQQEQRTGTKTGPSDTGRQWQETFDFDVTDVRAEGETNEIIVVVKESKGNKKGGGGKEEECGRVRIPLEDLEDKQEVDRWFPLSKNQKPTPAIVHLKLTYSYSIISELISIFSEVTEEEVVKEKLSLSALQYNVVRVVLALLPVFRIFKQFLELTRWKNPAASAFALQLFVMVLVFDYLATFVCFMGVVHFSIKFYEYYRQSLSPNYSPESEDSKSKGKKDQSLAGSNPQAPKTSIFEKIKKAQTIAGKIADRIEPLKDLWEWKDPEKSIKVMYALVGGTFLFLFMDWTILLRYTLLLIVLYLFTLKTLYARYPRFRKKYHISVLLPVFKEKLREFIKQVIFYLRKRRMPTSLFGSSSSKRIILGDLNECEIAGFLTKQGAVRKTWKRRYFVLGTKELYYFESDDPKEEIVGLIDLSHCTIVESPQLPNANPPSPHLFELFDSEIPRHYYLTADSAEEKRDWINVLQAGLKDLNRKRLRRSGPLPPVPNRPVSPIPQEGDQEHLLPTKEKSNPSLAFVPASASTPNLSRNAKSAKKKLMHEITVSSIPDPARTGYLQKQGERRKAWKTRYFVLAGSSLFYFKKSLPREMAINYIPLDNCTISEATVSEKKHPFCGIDIHLSSSNRHYLLLAQNDLDRKDWIEALKEAQTAPPLQALQRKPLPTVPIDGLESLASEASDATDATDSYRSSIVIGRGSKTRFTQFEYDPATSPPGEGYGEKICLADITNPTVMGTIQRHEASKVTIRRAWKKRFVVVANGKIYFFNSNNEKEICLDSTSLEGCVVTELPGYNKARPHSFEISKSQPPRQILLATESDKDKVKWMQAIRHAIEIETNGNKEKESQPETLPSMITQLHRLAAKGENDEVDRILWEYKLKEEEEAKALEAAKEENKGTEETVPGGNADSEGTKPSEQGVEKEKEKESDKEKERDKPVSNLNKITYAGLLAGTDRKNGQTLLHTSVEAGNLAMVKLLIEKHNANVNAYDRLAWTPLHTAAHCNHLAIYDYLLRNGADVNAVSMDEATPMHYLVRCESKKSFKVLEDSFAPLKGQTGDNEEYLLFLISESLNRGADINAANNRGESCLHNAVKKGNFKVVKFLLERNADVTHRNALGANCVDVAQRENNDELLALLRAYEIVAKEGRTDPKKRAPSVPAGPKPHIRKPLPIPPAHPTNKSPRESPSSLEEDSTPSESHSGSLTDEPSLDEKQTDSVGDILTEIQRGVAEERERSSPATQLHTTHSTELSLPFLMEEEDKRRGLVPIDVNMNTSVDLGESSDISTEDKDWDDRLSSTPNEFPSISDYFSKTTDDLVSPREKLEPDNQARLKTLPVKVEKEIFYTEEEDEPDRRRASTFIKGGIDTPSSVDKDSVSLFSIGAARSLPREPTLEEEHMASAAKALQESLSDNFPNEETEVINRDRVTLGQLVVGGSVVTGYLKLRQGTVRKVWKKLYFVLKGTDFFFFPSSSSRERPAGYFSLPSCTVEGAKEEIKGEKHCIIITQHDPKKTFALAAESKEEKVRWVDELHRRQANSRLPFGRGTRVAHHSSVF